MIGNAGSRASVPEVVFGAEFTREAGADSIRAWAAMTTVTIERILDSLKREIDEHQAGLDEFIAARVSDRRRELLALQRLEADLGTGI